MSLARCALVAALAVLIAPAAAAAAGDPIMPLDQVRRGMHCTGYTVIRGTDVTSFDVVVDDVVYDAADTANILITISGPAVDDTGAGPGFSGSPIYCPSPSDGTPAVIGALSFGIGAYDNKTVLATPIEAMLGESVKPPASARRARPAERHARPLAALSVAGLSPPVAAAFSRAAARAGRTLYAAPSAPRTTSFPVQALRPGSAMAVGYSSGDIAFGGIGTVTYVDGDAIWGFGHPLDSVGRRSVFLQDAYVYDVISSPAVGGGQSSYKLAAPGHDIGTLSGDGIFSVAGTVGALPPHDPLTVTAHDIDLGTTAKLSVELADERLVGNPTGFSPLAFVGTAAIAQAAYGILHGSPLNTSGNMCASFKLAERRKRLGFCNTYVAAGAGYAPDGSGSLAGTGPVLDFSSATSVLDSYHLGPLHVTDVSVRLNLRRGLAQGYMRRVTGPHRMQRGREYPLKLTFVRPGGGREAVAITVHVPLGMSRGRRELVLSGTPSDLAGGGFSQLLSSFFSDDSFDEAGPRSLRELSRQISGIHRYDGVTASFRPRRGRGESLSSPTSADSLPNGAEGRALRERPVYRDPNRRLSGAVGLRVVVR